MLWSSLGAQAMPRMNSANGFWPTRQVGTEQGLRWLSDERSVGLLTGCAGRIEPPLQPREGKIGTLVLYRYSWAKAVRPRTSLRARGLWRPFEPADLPPVRPPMPQARRAKQPIRSPCPISPILHSRPLVVFRRFESNLGEIISVRSRNMPSSVKIMMALISSRHKSPRPVAAIHTVTRQPPPPPCLRRHRLSGFRLLSAVSRLGAERWRRMGIGRSGSTLRSLLNNEQQSELNSDGETAGAVLQGVAG